MARHEERKLDEIEYVDVALINPPSFDIRYFRSKSFIARLARDIDRESFPTPIIIRRRGKRFDPIDGYTRVLAYRKLGRTKIPSIVVTVDDDVEATWKRLKLGINHRDFDAMGVAEALLWLCSRGVRQKDLCTRLQWSKSYVSKLIAIARHLSKEDKLRLAKGEISISEAYNLVPHRWMKNETILDFTKVSAQKLSCHFCNEEKEEQYVHKVRLCHECQHLLHKALKKKKKQKTLLDSRQLTI